MAMVGHTGDVNVLIWSGTVVFVHEVGNVARGDRKEGVGEGTVDPGVAAEGVRETGFEGGGDTRGDVGGETDIGRAGDGGSI